MMVFNLSSCCMKQLGAYVIGQVHIRLHTAN